MPLRAGSRNDYRGRRHDHRQSNALPFQVKLNYFDFNNIPRFYKFPWGVNKLIANLFKDAQDAAWQKVKLDAEVQDLIAAQKLRDSYEALQTSDSEAANKKFDEAEELLRQTRNK